MANIKDNFLEIRNIKKTYGVVRALRGVTFSIKKGEVHTLLGENGAGKSTLVKIIKGEVTPDVGGEILVDGKKIKEYNPLYAQKLGISMVHQELAIFENMTVAENIFPTVDFRTKFGLVDRKALYEAAQKSIDMFGVDIEPHQMMDTLTLAQQQMVEILRCISLDQRIILLDEPTSGLNSDESSKDFALKGNVDCAHTLTFGSIDDVIKETKDCLRIAGPGGGYICSSSNSIHSKVKPENYKAMVETIQEFGTYPIML